MFECTFKDVENRLSQKLSQFNLKIKLQCIAVPVYRHDMSFCAASNSIQLTATEYGGIIMQSFNVHVQKTHSPLDTRSHESQFEFGFVGKLQQVHKFHHFSVRVQYVSMFAIYVRSCCSCARRSEFELVAKVSLDFRFNSILLLASTTQRASSIITVHHFICRRRENCLRTNKYRT